MSLILGVMGMNERISGSAKVLKRSVIKASNLVKKKAKRKEGSLDVTRRAARRPRTW